MRPLRGHAEPTRGGPAHVGVEVIDQPIPRGDAVDEPAPEALVPSSIEILDVHALLLDPGVVPEIEDARAAGMTELEHVVVDDALEVAAEELPCIDLVEPTRIASLDICTPLARVHRGAVRRDGHDDVIGAVLEMLRELDGPDDVGEPRDTDVVELAHELGVELAPPGEIRAADFAAEQLIEAVACRVRYGDDGIGVHDVVDQRDVLVADALDVVLAVAVAQHGRAFERFDGGNRRPVPGFEMIAGGDRPRRAGGRHEGREPVATIGDLQVREDAIECPPGTEMVDEVIGELRKLVENHVLRIARQLTASVVDFLDVALRAWRADDVRGIGDPLKEPVETLTAHAGREHCHATASENAGDGHAAAAVVPGGWPDRAIAAGVESSGDQPRHQARIGCEHLVRGDHRKPAAQQHDDRSLDSGELRGKDDVARDRRAFPAIGTVEPMDPPEIRGIRCIGVDAG